jgi:biopolymer transport protein ExbB
MKTKHILLITITATLMLAATALHAEGEAAPGAAPAVHHKTLWEQIREGGWVMIPIGLCSIFTVYLIGDGVIRTSDKKVVPPEHLKTLKDLFRQGDYVGAYQYSRDNPSPFTNVLQVGLSLLGEGKAIAEEGMLGELSKENGKVQTWINYLSVIGVCTPMIGLLGTVTGMMKAFGTLASSGIGDPSSLSGAIGEVLVATASGLFIAIPAFGAFYFLRARAGHAIHHIQDSITSLFRKMPYESLAGVHIGDDELYAAIPNWLAPAEGAAGAVATAQ